jgi:hypothetical protein
LSAGSHGGEVTMQSFWSLTAIASLLAMIFILTS